MPISSRQLAAIRFVDFEDLGSLAPVFAAQGYQTTYYDAACDDLTPLLRQPPAMLVVLGGPIGAYEAEAYPQLRVVMQVLERQLAAQAPVLGICLGAQLIAHLLGARVYPGAAGKEIGWSPLALTPEGQKSALRHCDGALTPVLHWHGDTFDLPAGATLLASTPRYANQAFHYHGGRVLGLQCHIDLCAARFERWLIGHACEIAHCPDVTVAGLRADTARYGGGLEVAAQRTLQDWLEGLH